jgi:hypothetical protein
VDGILDISRITHLFGNYLGDEFGIGRGTEDLALAFILVPKFPVIYQVAIVSDRDEMIPEKKIEGLCIFRAVGAGSRIAYVPYADIP